MAKIKRPLEMANGFMARNLEELRSNFDFEKIVTHFLDDKLYLWLQDRYYDDEAEQISNLSKEDSNFAKKLCDILKVEFNENSIIDVAEIETKNKRISKLKQFTDDKEIIANIDSVAFNQEELAALYNKSIEKIYLCEGKFKIPESKINLEYIEIGEAIVNYPVIKPKNYITRELADILCVSSNYVELDDYIVWDNFIFELYDANKNIRDIVRKDFYKDKTIQNTNGKFMAWNKNTNVCFAFDIPHIKKDRFIDEMISIGNKIIISEEYTHSFYVFDLETMQEELLISCKEMYKINPCGALNGTDLYYISYTGGRRNSDRQIKKINIITKEIESVICDSPDAYHSYIGEIFYLNGIDLYYYRRSNNHIEKYNLKTKKTVKLYKCDKREPNWYQIYNDELFVHLGGLGDDEEFICISSDGTAESIFIKRWNSGYSIPYTNIFKKEQDLVIFDCYFKDEINAFDFKTKKLKKIQLDFIGHNGSRYIGDYFYYSPESYLYNPWRIDTKKEFIKDNFEYAVDDEKYK